MKISPEHYRDSARARAITARILLNHGRYSAAIYFSGACVESILRAYITRENPEFDEKHDLVKLYNASQIEKYITNPKSRRKINVCLGNVWDRWKNSYRYADDDRLRSEFKRLKFYVGVQGDLLKFNSSLCVDSALEIQTIGELRWNSKKK